MVLTADSIAGTLVGVAALLVVIVATVVAQRVPAVVVAAPVAALLLALGLRALLGLAAFALEALLLGTGLGLAIVRHVVRAHGGDARFLPVDGGCRIEVRLPLEAGS